MNRLRLIGLCIVAVVATSAVMTASASAVAPEPEYGRCIKKVKVDGSGFADSKCNKGVASKAKYEWLPGAVKKGQTTLNTTGGTLETVNKLGVHCTSETSTGEYLGSKEVKNIIVRFKGCQSVSFTCTSPGREVGELETKTLEGNVVIEKRFFKEGKEEPNKNKVAFDLYPAGKTGLFIEFSCVDISAVKVEGSILVPVKANTMLTTGELKYSATRGKQKPEFYETPTGEKVQDVLFSEFVGKGKGFEQAGQTITTKLTNEEPLELNSVV